MLPMHVTAETPAASEYAVKAALVFKIAKFVSWPDQAFNGLSAPLSVCVLENDPLVTALSTLNGKPIHGRAFSVRHFDESNFIASKCQILLVNSNYNERQLSLLDTISDQPVLTIVDNGQFDKSGGIIGLEIEQSHVQLAINLAASENAGLDISAQLLQLAKITDNRQGT